MGAEYTATHQLSFKPFANIPGGIAQEENIGGVETGQVPKTHVYWWYDFPQDFPGSLTTDLLKEFCPHPPATVLDPFCGSGTSLVSGKFLGHRAIGVEVNPLLCFVSQAKTNWDLDLDRVKEEAVILAKVLTRLDPNAPTIAKPSVTNGMSSRELAKWLDEETIAEAALIQKLIDRTADLSIRRFFLLAFSKALYEVSKAKYCPGITFLKRRKQSSLANVFSQRLLRMIAELPYLSSQYTGRAHVIQGDARSLSKMLPAESVDVVVTSPPYPGDVEYTRLFRLEMYFLRFVSNFAEIQAIKKKMIRASPKNIFKADNNQEYVRHIPSVHECSEAVKAAVKGKAWGWDYPRMVREYFGDMWIVFNEVKRVLKKGRYAIFIVGDQTIKGTLVSTGQILKDIAADVGYAQVNLETYRIRRSSTHSIPLTEHMVKMRK